MEIRSPKNGEVIRSPVMSERSGKESFLLTEFADFEILDTGAFGIVIKCRNRLDDGYYAVKIVSASSITPSLTGNKTRDKIRSFDTIRQEVKALARLQHPYIVRYHQAWLEDHFAYRSSDGRLTCVRINVDSPCLHIQMEYCPRSLKEFLLTQPDLNEEMAWKLFCQIMEGLAKVHESGVAHCDLTAANILLDEEDNIRICDFGRAVLYEPETKLTPHVI